MRKKSVVRGGRYISKNTKAQSLFNLRAGNPICEIHLKDLMEPLIEIQKTFKILDILKMTNCERINTNVNNICSSIYVPSYASS